MTSNDVDFFSFQFISPKLERSTYITGRSIFVLHMQGAHFTGYGFTTTNRGPKVNIQFSTSNFPL